MVRKDPLWETMGQNPHLKTFEVVVSYLGVPATSFGVPIVEVELPMPYQKMDLELPHHQWGPREELDQQVRWAM